MKSAISGNDVQPTSEKETQPTPEQDIMLDWWMAQFFDKSNYTAAQIKIFRDNIFRYGMKAVTIKYRHCHPQG